MKMAEVLSNRRAQDELPHALVPRERSDGSESNGTRERLMTRDGALGNGRVGSHKTSRQDSPQAPGEREQWLAALLAHSSDLIAVVDDQARVLYANQAAERVLGYVPDEQLGRSLFELVHPDDLGEIAARFLAATRRSGDSRSAVFRFRTAAGEWRTVEATATNRLNDPAIKGMVINAHDVTEQTNLSRALRTLGQGNQVLVRATEEAALLADTCRTIVASGEYLMAWVGYVEHDEASTVRAVASAGRTEYLNGLRVGWGDDEAGRGPTGTAIRTRTVQVLKDMHRSKKFAPWRTSADACGFRTSCALPLVVDDTTIGALMIYAGEPGTFGPDEVELLLDLAQDLAYGIGRLRDAARLAHNEGLLREAERIAHVGHWEWDLATGRVDFMADEMFAIYGITARDWDGTQESFFGLVAENERQAVRQAIDSSLKRGSAEVEHSIVRPDGEVRFVRTRTEAVGGADERAVRLVGTCQDITGQKAVEQEIEHSRRFLSAITDNMAEGMIATDNAGRVTFVNAAAERLLGWKAADLLGRSAHDSYHFQWPDGSPYLERDCPFTEVWERGERLLVDHDTFIRRDGTMFPVSYSASPLQGDQISGSVVVFDDITERAAERLRVERELEKLTWVGRIRDALDQGRFVLYAQPIVDLKTKAVVQHELLIRMVSPTGEIVLPDRFLPTAEEFGLISEIDRWVVNETIRLAAQGHPVEFNLSAKSVVDPNMLTIVRNAFEVHGASPESVVCEITETALLRDTAAAEAFVQGLNQIGCKVALDDFGSGYGGFAYLKRLPVSFLKIDMEFVRDLAQEASSRHVVSAVVNLAKAFSMRTVGEGAEDDTTVELLAQLGVDRAQGYVIARPGPVAEVLASVGLSPS
jgi:PAS domain S-box-containing protein